MGDKQKQTWETFQNKMADLRKRQATVLALISKKLDQQKIGSIIKKLKK
ncbi:MAG: hypothetical protein WCK16_04265 [Candidatus Moraniibacteriota bacterium]